MKRILFATHGKMADGVVSAIRLIAGETAEIACINAYLDGGAPTKELEQFFAGVKPDDQVMILADLFGGSVNKELVPYLARDQVYLIAGFNLAMALEVATMGKDEVLSEEFCQSLVETGKKQVVFVNDCLKAAAEKADDEEVFL